MSYPYTLRVAAGTEKSVTPKTVNIDGSDDPFYRYKMTQLITYVHGEHGSKMVRHWCPPRRCCCRPPPAARRPPPAAAAARNYRR